MLRVKKRHERLRGSSPAAPSAPDLFCGDHRHGLDFNQELRPKQSGYLNCGAGRRLAEMDVFVPYFAKLRQVRGVQEVDIQFNEVM